MRFPAVREFAQPPVGGALLLRQHDRRSVLPRRALRVGAAVDLPREEPRRPSRNQPVDDRVPDGGEVADLLQRRLAHLEQQLDDRLLLGAQLHPHVGELPDLPVEPHHDEPAVEHPAAHLLRLLERSPRAERPQRGRVTPEPERGEERLLPHRLPAAREVVEHPAFLRVFGRGRVLRELIGVFQLHPDAGGQQGLHRVKVGAEGVVPQPEDER